MEVEDNTQLKLYALGAMLDAAVTAGFVRDALAGVAIAHAMFELPIVQFSQHTRSGGGQWLGEGVATFGLILFFNELIAILWGRAALYSSIPEYLSGHVQLTESLRYPFYRLVIIGTGLAVAALLLLASRNPAIVILAAMLGNVAVGTGETGPFLSIEQVVIARAVAARNPSSASEAVSTL